MEFPRHVYLKDTSCRNGYVYVVAKDQDHFEELLSNGYVANREDLASDPLEPTPSNMDELKIHSSDEYDIEEMKEMAKKLHIKAYWLMKPEKLAFAINEAIDELHQKAIN